MKHLITEIQIDTPPEKVWGLLAEGPRAELSPDVA